MARPKIYDTPRDTLTISIDADLKSDSMEKCAGVPSKPPLGAIVEGFLRAWVDGKLPTPQLGFTPPKPLSNGRKLPDNRKKGARPAKRPEPNPAYGDPTEVAEPIYHPMVAKPPQAHEKPAKANYMTVVDSIPKRPAQKKAFVSGPPTESREMSPIQKLFARLPSKRESDLTKPQTK